MRWLVVIIWLGILPQVVTASVRINEVAWMGTAESYLCNWIELYNQSDTPVDITDWVVEIDDTPRAISEGEGEAATVPGGGFLLLERVTTTCPDAMPTVSGWNMMLGNMPNRGAVLTLRRADGTVADRVVGGEDWQNLGGDNDSKQTAQRTPGGWITARATPAAINPTDQTATETAANQSGTTDTSTNADSHDHESSNAHQSDQSNNSGNGTILNASAGQLQLQITAPETTYVGQPITVDSDSFGVGSGVANSLHYQWNFGDRHTTTKPDPTHTYAFPGTYVITLRGSYATYDAVARHEITVLPVRLTVGRDADQNIQIHNNAPYEMDLSGFTLRGTRSVTFPERTILLPKQTLTIERDAVEGAVAGLVTIRDRQRKIVANNTDSVKANYLPSQTPDEAKPVPQVAGISSSATTNRYSSPRPALVVPDEPDLVTHHATASGAFISRPATSGVSTTSTAGRSVLHYWPYIALIGLVIVTAGLLFLPRRPRERPAETADLFGE